MSGAIQASAGSSIGLGGVILILLAIGAYFLPTILGARRKVINVGSVFAINLLLGWTLIGWAIALAMAKKIPWRYLSLTTPALHDLRQESVELARRAKLPRHGQTRFNAALAPCL